MRPLRRSLAPYYFLFFFFNDPATTEIYTLSLHDALPISDPGASAVRMVWPCPDARRGHGAVQHGARSDRRSEEHTSELQSRPHLVCRLLLEKKKQLTIQPLPSVSQHRYTRCPISSPIISL